MADLTETHIAALDLGTSKMSLAVAKVNGRDVQIVYYKEAPSAGVRYSGVWNMMQASDPISSLISDANNDLGLNITQAIVGIPKYPVRQESNSGKVMDRGEDTEITAEDIANLKRFAKETYPLNDPAKEAIYGAVAQSFSDGEDFFQIIENDIIGMTSNTLEGHFKIFIGKKKEILHGRDNRQGCPDSGRDGKRSRPDRFRRRQHIADHILRKHYAPLCVDTVRRQEHN